MTTIFRTTAPVLPLLPVGAPPNQRTITTRCGLAVRSQPLAPGWLLVEWSRSAVARDHTDYYHQAVPTGELTALLERYGCPDADGCAADALWQLGLEETS